MRTRKHWIEWAILGVLGSLVLLSLATPQLLREREDPQMLALSVLLRDTDSSGWSAARQGMEQAADELGAELRFLTPTVQGDSREQEELLRRETEGRADGLVIFPAGGEGLYNALYNLPCPAVTLEAAAGEGVWVVGPDNEQVGRSLAQALLEDWDGGEVFLLEAAGCPEVLPRLEAAQAVLTQAGVPSVRGTDLPQDRARVRWVMAFEPLTTRQSAERKEAEDRQFALYGVGSAAAVTTRLERGTIAAVAAWSDYAAGYLAVEQAVRAIQGEAGEPEPLPCSIVRGEDIYEPENQKLLFPVAS